MIPAYHDMWLYFNEILFLDQLSVVRVCGSAQCCVFVCVCVCVCVCVRVCVYVCVPWSLALHMAGT